MRTSLVAASFAAVALLGCPGSLENPSRFGGGDSGGGTDGGGVSCDDIDVEQDILVATCGVGFCHDADAPSAGLDLASAGVMGRLVDIAPSVNGVVGSMCEGDNPLINTTTPADSLMLQKINDTASCGTIMPPTGFTFMEGHEACLIEWINNAAGGT